jgi:hypothetical protein
MNRVAFAALHPPYDPLYLLATGPPARFQAFMPP